MRVTGNRIIVNRIEQFVLQRCLGIGVNRSRMRGLRARLLQVKPFRIGDLKDFRCERGSASVEFVLWVLPLFLPLVIVIGQVSEIASSKMEAMQLARTALRAFVSAPNTATGHLRVQQVLSLSPGTKMSYNLGCAMKPCIRPNNFVQLTLIDHGSEIQVSVATGTGRWIEGEPGFKPVDTNAQGIADVEALEDSLSWVEHLGDVMDRLNRGK